MFPSKGFRISSHSETLPPPLFYTAKPSTPWHADVLQSIKLLFTMCCGNRIACKTSDAAVRILEEGKSKREEDCEPLIGGGVEESVEDGEKREALRVTFPRHAAASFLKTGTSRGMREANWVL
ncbi:hypothetical protein J3F83DRAFT_759052 [Trichoderma novae-zelandiae]